MCTPQPGLAAITHLYLAVSTPTWQATVKKGEEGPKHLQLNHTVRSRAVRRSVHLQCLAALAAQAGMHSSLLLCIQE